MMVDLFRGFAKALNHQTLIEWHRTLGAGHRDLVDLIAKQALLRRGKRCHTRYDLAIPLQLVAAVSIDDAGKLH